MNAQNIVDTLKEKLVAYEPIKLDDANFMKYELRYEKGGWSYFTGEHSARGYWLAVFPVERTKASFSDDSSYYLEYYRAFTGAKHFLSQKPIARKSNRELERAKARLTSSLIEELTSYVIG